jgi:hypothetical protein
MAFWGTSDPTGLSGDAEPDNGTGSNTLQLPQASPAYPVAGAPDLSSIPGLGDILGSVSPGAFDPSTLGAGGGSSSDLLSLLSLLGGSNGGGTGNIGSLLGGGSTAGNLIAQLLGPLFGINQGGSSAEGGAIGGAAGGALGSLLGPGGTLAGSAIGDLLGNLLGGAIGGGIPSSAKPEALAGSLKASGNPLEELLGKYIQTQGVNKGYDLSGGPNTPFNPRRFGDVIELLSGQSLPNRVGGNVGFQNPVTLSGWKQGGAINSMLPNANILNMNQLSQIFPEISKLVNEDRSKKGGLMGLLQQENSLAGKLKAAESY